MLIKLAFCGAIVLICGYNINTDFPIIGSGRVALVYNGTNLTRRLAANNNTYFGYSILMGDRIHHRSPFLPGLIVGAPKGSYHWPRGSSNLEYPRDSGVVYACVIMDIISCVQLLPSIKGNENGFIAQLGMKTIIRMQDGWLGSAMSMDKSADIITVCAPRTMITIFNNFEDPNPETMQGMCYSMRLPDIIDIDFFFGEPLKIEDRNLESYDFSTRFWYNPLHGFSIHYASDSGNTLMKVESSRIIGEPMHDLYGRLDVKHSMKRISVGLPNSDDLSQFGYSVTAGYYFQKNELLYASGAPGWRYIGQVGIVNPMASTPIVASVHGSEVGEFFGASLASGDINNDGLDDLLVGAPHFGNDDGKVYLYLGSTKKQFENVLQLRGSVEGGYFGYSIACGDLDADGFVDIIVGAPWEDNGVVYIYNGAADLSERNTLEVSQRISVIGLPQFNKYGLIERFGFSLAEPGDIDGNGYADIAVGAYKSEHVVVLLARPVVTTQLSLEFIPHLLQRNTKEFMIKVCSKHHGYKLKTTSDYKISLTLDEEYRRTKDTYLELRSSEPTDLCVYGNVTILDHVRDFIEPIAVVARHSFLYKNETYSTAFDSNTPIENKNNKMNIVQEFLAFDIGCGEDKVCSADILANATFYGVQCNDTWIIGSDGMSLEVRLENLGEPAYLANLVFTFPERIVLRSILPSCQEDESGSSLVVTCDVGNPLGQGEKKIVKLDLDMRHLSNGTMHGSKLKFLARINSRSSNRGTKEIEKVLDLVSEVSLSLNGQANDKSYYLSAMKEELLNVSFQHVYQIYKLGMTPIEEARLIVKVPTGIKNWGTLIHVYEPQLFVSGEVFPCLSDDTPLLHEITHSRLEEKTTQSYNEDIRSLRKSDTDRQSLAVVLQEMQSLYRPDQSETIKDMTHSLYIAEPIYFNCTSSNVTCSTIVCNLSSLKSLMDVAKILLKLVLDTRALKRELTEDAKILRFSSEARVEILAPDNSVAVFGTRSTMDVTTTFYSVPKFKELQLWVIILSVSVGLLLLLIIVIALSVVGFFRRSSKEELSALKSKEVSLKDVNKEGEPFWSSEENTYEQLD